MTGKKENLIIPIPHEDININGLHDAVTDYVNKVLEKGEYPEDSDDEHYIFEEALKTIYGKDVFKKLNGINL